MKLHDNSCFLGLVIVVLPHVNLLKSQVLIELPSIFVGGPDFQEYISLKSFQSRPEQAFREMFSAVLRRGCYVQDLALILRQTACDQEARNRSAGLSHPQLVVEIVPRVPLRGLPRLVLNGFHRGQIVRSAASEYWHHDLIIMHALVPLLLLLAQPFWEQRPPEQWTAAEIDSLRTNSPWAQWVGQVSPVTVFLATALPIEHAEAELRLRFKKNRGAMGEPDPDYVDYLRQHRAEVFILGVAYPPLPSFGKAGEDKIMEEQTALVIGRKQYQILGYFPPSPSDPVLRLVFPRVVKPTDKELVFRLYFPGLNFPEREAVFVVKDLMYQGKLQM